MRIGKVEKLEAMLEGSGGVEYHEGTNNITWFITPRPVDSFAPSKQIEFFTDHGKRAAVYRDYPKGSRNSDRDKDERGASLTEVIGLASAVRESLPGSEIAQEVADYADVMLEGMQAAIGDLVAKFAVIKDTPSLDPN